MTHETKRSPTLLAHRYERGYRVPGDEPSTFLWQSAMMKAWQIDPTNSRLWTEAEPASARRAAALDREWIRSLPQDVEVHHILPRPDGIHWDGLLDWSATRRYGALFVFRLGSGEQEQTVRLKTAAAGL